MSWLIRMLGTRTNLFDDEVWIADSTPVECGRPRKMAKRSDLAGFAEYGCCAWERFLDSSTPHSEAFPLSARHAVTKVGGHYSKSARCSPRRESQCAGHSQGMLRSMQILRGGSARSDERVTQELEGCLRPVLR